MSPEQARHEDIDGRADIYSAGVMLFEVFTGDRLVDEQDQSTLWQRVLNPKHRSPKTVVPTLPDIIERLIMQAVEVKPIDRFESAQQMRSFAARLSRPDTSREAMVRYLLYLYPKVDFKPPVIPQFDNLSGGTEQSIIIATSDKGALSVFGRGDLPIECPMQLDSKAIRVAVEETRRKQAALRQDEPITDANMQAGMIRGSSEPMADPTLLRSTLREFDQDEHRTTAETSVGSVDDRTQVARRPSTTSKTTRYVRGPDQRQEHRSKGASAEKPRIKAGPGEIPKARTPYRDDEMTVMMNAPPQARALFGGDTPTQLSTLREDMPKPMVQQIPSANTSPMHAPSRRMRAIKEKNIARERATRNERPENRPRRKKAIEVHRRTVPVETQAVPETRHVREAYQQQTEPASRPPEPFPWMMWGLVMLGLAVFIVALVIVMIAF